MHNIRWALRRLSYCLFTVGQTPHVGSLVDGFGDRSSGY